MRRERAVEDVGNRDRFAGLADHTDPWLDVGAKDRSRDDAELRRAKSRVGGSPPEEEEAAIDGARHAVVEPEAAANANALSRRTDEVIIGAEDRHRAGFAEEAESIRVRTGRSKDGNPKSRHPPEEIFALDEAARSRLAIARMSRAEPVAKGSPAKFGQRRIVAAESNRRGTEGAVLAGRTIGDHQFRRRDGKVSSVRLRHRPGRGKPARLTHPRHRRENHRPHRFHRSIGSRRFRLLGLGAAPGFRGKRSRVDVRGGQMRRRLRMSGRRNHLPGGFDRTHVGARLHLGQTSRRGGCWIQRCPRGRQPDRLSRGDRLRRGREAHTRRKDRGLAAGRNDRSRLDVASSTNRNRVVVRSDRGRCERGNSETDQLDPEAFHTDTPSLRRQSRTLLTPSPSDFGHGDASPASFLRSTGCDFSSNSLQIAHTTQFVGTGSPC